MNHKDTWARSCSTASEITPTRPQNAIQMGIATVFQEINLCPNLTVAENIFVGRKEFKRKIIYAKARELMQRFHWTST